jgi:hypothetical protein
MHEMRHVPSFAKALEREHDADAQEQSDPNPIDDANGLAFLQAIYRDPRQPLAVRLRAAIEALPFESPKLSVTALLHPGDDFATRLERAIERTRVKLIEGNAVELQQPE